MTYGINITGHKDTASDEASEAFEKQIASQAREFVSTLEGVVSATLDGNYVHENLMAETKGGE